MKQIAYSPRLAAAHTSHPITKRQKQVGSLPQVVPLSSTPITGPAYGAVEGGLVGGVLGWLIGHFGGGKKDAGKKAAMIGAGVAAVAGGALGYYEAMNPTVSVSPGGSYTVNVPANGGNLNINAPSGATASFGSGSSNATVFLAGQNFGTLQPGSNTISVSWTDGSGNPQSATITANVQ
jgi:hypothetical protein